MKNIHILPTEKPSRLFVTDGKLFNYHKPQKGDGIKIINQNIYITSDEPAYPYALHLKNREVFKTRAVGSNSLELYHDKGFSYPEECKKIILTTDQDLIKDGVQAIDDEFLEWFVKNPSFEGVEVQDISMQYHDEGYYEYKIIIPKEEPKQEFPKQNIIDNWLEKNGDPEIDKQVEQEAKDLCEQETLEEAATNYTIDFATMSAFKLGAKWQQEQDKKRYSEEEVVKFGQYITEFDNLHNESEYLIKELLEHFKTK